MTKTQLRWACFIAALIIGRLAFEHYGWTGSLLCCLAYSLGYFEGLIDDE